PRWPTVRGYHLDGWARRRPLAHHLYLGTYNRSPLWAKDRPYTDSEADAGYGTWSPSARMFGYHTYDAISLYDVNGKYITPPAGSCNQFQYFSLGHYQTIATNGNQVTGPVT